MIAIAGTLGTGLFLGSGKAIANGGPVGALLGYGIVGILVGCMMYCLGEMMVYDPSAAGFIEFARRYIDPAAGFAMGWQVSSLENASSLVQLLILRISCL